MKRISFDYDGTLDRENVFNAAKQCVDAGFELWIVTSRYTEEEYKKNNLCFNNHDLFETANLLGIPNERIIFTNNKSKSKFFESSDKEFIAHLDDDIIDLEDIRDLYDKGKTIIPICVIIENWDTVLSAIINI